VSIRTSHSLYLSGMQHTDKGERRAVHDQTMHITACTGFCLDSRKAQLLPKRQVDSGFSPQVWWRDQGLGWGDRRRAGDTRGGRQPGELTTG
jgi:hypothetical protein